MSELCSQGCRRKPRRFRLVAAAAARVAQTLPAGQADGALVLMGRLLVLSFEVAGSCPRCAFNQVLRSGLAGAMAELGGRRTFRHG